LTCHAAEPWCRGTGRAQYPVGVPSVRRRALALFVVAAVIVGLVTLVAVPVLRELRFTAVSREQALEALEQTRRRFAGQVPLIRVAGSNGLPAVAVTHGPADAQRKPVRELLVLAYDPHDGQLVRTKVPLWAVRLGGWRNFVLRTLGRPDLQVTVEDIERHGPGLIADIRGPGGTQALMWAE
jgi:hypothetical protein